MKAAGVLWFIVIALVLILVAINTNNSEAAQTDAESPEIHDIKIEEYEGWDTYVVKDPDTGCEYWLVSGELYPRISENGVTIKGCLAPMTPGAVR